MLRFVPSLLISGLQQPPAVGQQPGVQQVRGQQPNGQQVSGQQVAGQQAAGQQATVQASAVCAVYDCSSSHIFSFIESSSGLVS